MDQNPQKKKLSGWIIALIVAVSLVVVLAILGVFVTVVLLNLNVARSKARDAMRMSDVDQIQMAVEQYYDTHKQAYPTDITNEFIGSYFATKVAPTDPVTGAPYGYAMDRATGRYQVYAVLQNKSRLLDVDADVDASKWSPNPGINGVIDCYDPGECTQYIYDLSNN